MQPIVLLPNFCAEEDIDWRLLLAQPLYRRLALLWRLLFGTEVVVKGVDDFSLNKIHSLFRAPSHPALDGLPTEQSGVAWLMTAPAALSLSRIGATPWGASPDIAALVHDKAFTKRWVMEQSLDPEPIRGLHRIFEADDLVDLEHFQQSLRESVAAWPEWAQQRWTLKPRFGSSGRGRLPGTFLRVNLPALPGAKARLMERGGVILEPFLSRDFDVSAQFFVHSPENIELLGTLRQSLSNSGSYEGHFGRIVGDRITAGTEVDEVMVRDAFNLVMAAARQGFLGICGVDGFSFHLEGKRHFRSCVELNARFTVGTVVVGLLRRILASGDTPTWLRDHSNFTFRLSPSTEECSASGDFVVRITEESQPALLIFNRR